MKRVRTGFPALIVATVALGGLLAYGAQSASAERGCFPANHRPVTVLARPGLGHAFLKLSGDEGAYPYLDVDAGRVMVPVRSLVTIITPAHDIAQWDEASRTATFRRGDQVLSYTFAPGSHATTTAMIDGVSVQTEAFLCGGKVFAPARFVAGALGSGIKWYRGDTVVVDPAWGPDPATVAVKRPATEAGGVIDGSARLGTGPEAGCDRWPHDITDYLLSPTEAARQAARAAACQWVLPH